MAQSKTNQPNYTNCLNIKQMRDALELFNEIPYKWVCESDDDDDIEVDILDLECDKPYWSKTQFTFDLYWKSQKKTFEVVLEYSNSAFYANYIAQLEVCACCDQPINGMDADSNEDGAICDNCANESDDEENKIVIVEPPDLQKDTYVLADYGENYSNQVGKKCRKYILEDYSEFHENLTTDEYNIIQPQFEENGYVEMYTYEPIHEHLNPAYIFGDNCVLYFTFDGIDRVIRRRFLGSRLFAWWLSKQIVEDTKDE